MTRTKKVRIPRAPHLQNKILKEHGFRWALVADIHPLPGHPYLHAHTWHLYDEEQREWEVNSALTYIFAGKE